MFNRSPFWKTALIGIAAASLVVAGLGLVIYVTIARNRLTASVPTLSWTFTPRPSLTLSLTPESTPTPIPPDAALGIVKDYSPGALIIVIQPIQGNVEQIIVPENIEVVWENGQRASPREITRGQTIYAEGTLDALGRLVATSIVIIDAGPAATATPMVTETSTPGAEPTPTIPYQAWLGEYYANLALEGIPVLVRQDPAIDFQWGTGSPGPNVPADRFSVRWRGIWPFEAGVYNFVAYSDDGVRIWVDGQAVVDQWVDQAATFSSGQIYLKSGEHLVEVEYYENSQRAEIRVIWEKQGAFANWKGEYFDNPNLQGEPVLVRNDEEISFNWGTASPHPNVPADNFSVRWIQDIAFEEGAYRFRARADDGIRVWVAGRLIIDAWQPNAGQTFTGYIWLPKGTHSVRIEYVEFSGEASAQVWREHIASFAYWQGSYFGNPDLAGDPSFMRDDEKIDFDWGQGSPGYGLPVDGFSVRWSRRLYLDAGRYNFWAIADDGVRVYVDDTLVIDAWRDSAPERYDGSATLEAGNHRIVVEYYERAGSAVIQFGWEWLPPATPTLTPTLTATSTVPIPTATVTPSPTQTSPPATETPTPTPTTPTPSE